MSYDGQIVTLLVRIDRYIVPSSKRAPYKIICSNETGVIALIYFNGVELIKNKYQIGQKIVISGKIEKGIDRFQMTHPDIVAPESDFEKIKSLEPIYPLTYGLNNKYLSETIRNIIKFLPKLPEWLPDDILNSFKLPSWNEAIYNIHHPKSASDVLQNTKAKDRLAIDELLAQQLSLQIARKNALKKPKLPLNFTGNLFNEMRKVLPFSLTQDQEDAISEISKEQSSSSRMVRLLQGDVGSGKTIVALSAALNAIEAGFQAAIMAPTEILARQHYNGLNEICKNWVLIAKF